MIYVDEFYKSKLSKIIEFNDGCFVVVLSPISKNYTYLLGNSLRRTLLSLLPQYSIINIKLKNIIHKYHSIEGITDDLISIILRLSYLCISLISVSRTQLFINCMNPCIIFSNYLLKNFFIRVVDYNVKILEILKKNKLNICLDIVRLNSNKFLFNITSSLFVNTINQFVYNVSFKPVNNSLYFEKLYIYYNLRGLYNPEKLLYISIYFLFEQFFLLEEKHLKKYELMLNFNKSQKFSKAINESLLMKYIYELELTTRSLNCLKSQKIYLIGDLIQFSELDLLRVPNLGKKSLSEIKNILSKFNLFLGTKLKNWPFQ